jgi:N-acetylglucosamine-6-sulfatase
VAWIRRLALENASRHQPWFVYLAPFAPHAPSTPAAWYNESDDCKGVVSPRIPSFNFTGLHKTSCSEYPPGTSRFQRDGPRQWWNGTDFPELTSCQPPITAADAVGIDAEARRRCQTLLSVDDTFTQVLAAVQELGQLNRTYVLVTSDHGYNLGHHMLISAKMLFYEHSLKIPMVFTGPGIRQNSSFDEWLGTQVDLAPSILALAGIDAPAWMDGRSVIPLLVSPQVATEQHEVVPGSTLRHLSVSSHGPSRPAARNSSSYHIFYNQGPWMASDGRHKMEDWSDTWHGIAYRDP